MSSPLEDLYDAYGDRISLEEWLELHGLWPDDEVPGDVFESMPDNLQQEYLIKHGGSEDASGDSVFVPQKKKWWKGKPE